jgi:hypothetical protein
MRPAYMSGGSTICESAEISLYSAIIDLLYCIADCFRPVAPK